jgi:SPP1 family predicted phage head-tail adaptor
VAIRAGKLRHRVILQSPVRSRDAHGGFVPLAWTDVRTLYASVEPKSGQEKYFSDKVLGQTSHIIVIRAQTETITTDMRLTWGSRVFNINAALREDEIQHKILIAATENTSIAEDTAGIENMIHTYSTDELDFTTTHSVLKSIPTNFRFAPDTFEVICTTLSGSIVTQPTVALGITGSLSKYRAPTLTTLVTAVNKRQGYSSLLVNESETGLRLQITTAGAVSVGGSYKGRLIVKGVLIPS